KMLERTVSILKEVTGYDAVGIRLKSNDDYPYFSQQGFDEEVLFTENSLLARDGKGIICRGKDGKPILECTCGLVLCGKSDPSSPNWTPGGSIWTNDSPAFLELPAEKDPRLNPRNKCIHKGYTSVALVPIRAKNEIIGLVQFNDRKKGCFSAEGVAMLENLAAHLGEALTRKKAEEDLVQANNRLKQLSITDDLTGLYNRRGFFEVARHHFHAAKRYKKPLALLFCDMDDLKQINDSSGHDAGDLAIKDAARALTQSVRAADVVARVGGDEFAILLPQSDDAAAQATAGRVHTALEALNSVRKPPLHISIGAHCADLDAMQDIDELLARADSDMYRVKQSKKPGGPYGRKHQP
ncbi:MAG TPA: sensor domain-containing diguanylate cyclase, partial [Elusimicrobiales bacterium]|nr:sensor domain-containing diguanylate cyclase [Elusimicrobiales bacterium]